MKNSYVLKRIFIGVSIGLLLMIARNVFAASCSGSTMKIGYVDGNSHWQSINATTIPFTSNIPIWTNKLSFSAVNTNIKNNHIDYYIKFHYVINNANFSFDNKDAFEFTYGKSGNRIDITNKCSVLFQQTNTGTADTTFYTNTYVDVYCAFDGSISDANEIQIIVPTTLLNTSGSMIATIDEYCLQIGPTDTQKIINNDDKNTLDILGNNYSQYRSLWDLFIDNYNDMVQINDENTQSINDNIDDMSDDVSDKIDELKDSQQVCKYYDNTNIGQENAYFYSGGAIGSSQNTNISDYIKINSSTILVLNKSDAYYSCFYDRNKNVISCANNNAMENNSYLTIPNNAEYLRYTMRKNINVPIFKICKNGNQALSDFIHSVSGDFFNTDGNMSGNLNGLNTCIGDSCGHSLGPLGLFINKPINIFTRIVNETNTDECTSLSIPISNLPFASKGIYSHVSGDSFNLKCIRNYIEEDIGFTYYETIGSLCGTILFVGFFAHIMGILTRDGMLKDTSNECWGGLA